MNHDTSQFDTGVKTGRFAEPLTKKESDEILAYVYQQLKIAGYCPSRQMAGFLLTGDPTYITSHGGARAKVAYLERFDILGWMTENYLNLEK